jgi:hypothetical protein
MPSSFLQLTLMQRTARGGAALTHALRSSQSPRDGWGHRGPHGRSWRAPRASRDARRDARESTRTQRTVHPLAGDSDSAAGGRSAVIAAAQMHGTR